MSWLLYGTFAAMYILIILLMQFTVHFYIPCTWPLTKYRQSMAFLSYSSWIRYSRACSHYECFILTTARLSYKLLGPQGYIRERLKSPLRKFFCRYWDLIKHNEVSLSQMLHDILGHDHKQWHPILFRYYTNLWPCYRIEPYPDFDLITKVREVSIEHLQRVRLDNRGRLLLWTCPICDLHLFLCWDNFFLNMSRFLTLNPKHHVALLFCLWFSTTHCYAMIYDMYYIYINYDFNNTSYRMNDKYRLSVVLKCMSFWLHSFWR